MYPERDEVGSDASNPIRDLDTYRRLPSNAAKTTAQARPNGTVLVEAVGVALVLAIVTAVVVRRITSMDQRIRLLNTLNPKFEKRWVKGGRHTVTDRDEPDDPGA
jgi:hypothetical protein